MSRSLPPGPGLARCGTSRPFARRTVQLVRADDALWSQWMQRADLISEGLATEEGGWLVYRGSTSVLVLSDRHGGLMPHEALEQALLLAERDPHLRLRCLRLARREAASRSPQPLDSSRAELCVRADPRGLRIDVDLEARVLSGRRLVKTKG
jgi:hypothetical protein